MADVSAALVKELRDKTGAGMMDCKRALAECSGSLEAAVDWLRKKGLSQAAKKAGRVTAEGLIGVAVKGRRAAMVEVNSETDFVARNPSFQDFVRTLAELALDQPGDAEALAKATYPGAGKPVGERLTELIATVGENMALRRVVRLEVPSGLVGSYVHAALAPGLGKIGVLVGIETTGTGERLETLGKQIAMHVAAANPQSVSRQDVDPADIERERRVLLEQATEAGKPAAVAEKMVEGRLRRFYEENCLVEQAFVMDDKVRVGQVLEEAATQLGKPVRVSRFVRFALGEGVAKKGDSFATDVASALKS